MKWKTLKISAFIALILMFLFLVSTEMNKLFDPLSLIVLVLGTTLLTIVTYQNQFTRDQFLLLISKNLVIVGFLTFTIGLVLALSEAKSVQQMGAYTSVSAIVLVYMLLGLIVIKLIQELSEKKIQPHHLNIDPIDPKHLQLTQREKEISSYILKGATNKEIAESLFISESTIKKQITQLFRKYEVKNRFELISKLKDSKTSFDDYK